MKKPLWLLLATASTLAMQEPVLAQGNQMVNQAEAGKSHVAPNGEYPKVDDIVVTGSRIVRDGAQAPTPLTVIGADDLSSRAPASIAQGLNQLPTFQGSVNANQTQVVTSNRVRSGNYLNLRGLGPQRLLVLQDGYRLPQSGNNGGVDTNIIPQMLVERVEIVTGGASAIYGSDAVSGVVNYVTDKKFKGLRTLTQAGLSDYGDAFSWRIGAAAGLSLLDNRLHILASAEHYHNNGIGARSARPGGAEKWITGGVDPTLARGAIGSSGNPYLDYSNVNISTASYGGLITAGPTGLRGLQFLSNGQLGPFNPGASIGRGGFGQGGDGIDFCVSCTLVPSVRTTQVFGRATYDLGSDAEGFVQVTYNTDQNRGENISFSKLGFPIFSDNIYLRQQLTPAQIALLGNQTLTLARTFIEFPVPGSRAGVVPSEQKMNGLIVRAGLAGKIGDWRWDVAAQHGRNRFTSNSTEVRNDRFLAAIDAVAGPNGLSVCRVTLVNPNRFPGCLPLNVLGAGRGADAAIAQIFDDSRWSSVNSIDLATANLSGSPLSTWAGPVSLAFGGEIRRQKLLQDSNSDPLVPIDYTSIRGGTGGAFFSTNVGTANGAYTVKEFYAEAVVPLAQDAFLAKSLEINGAFRHTHYSTSGGVNTWKVGSIWEPVEGLRMRGSYSRDIRAPSLFELFAGQTRVQQFVPDPQTGTSVSIESVSGGNPFLTPERAKTFTFGGVVTPSRFPGLHASVDYFDIRINDAISTPGNTLQIAQTCASKPQSGYCDFLVRNAAGVLVEVQSNNKNVAAIRTRGIDVELGYRKQLDNGAVRARVLATRLISYARQESNATPSIEYVGSADLPAFLASTQPLPKWQGNLEIGFERNGFNLAIQERIIGKYKKSNQFTWADNDVPTVFYTDITVSQGVNLGQGKMDLFVTVNNLFNRKPPFFVTDQNPGTQLPTARVLYDVTGRYVTLGVRTRI